MWKGLSTKQGAGTSPEAGAWHWISVWGDCEMSSLPSRSLKRTQWQIGIFCRTRISYFELEHSLKFSIFFFSCNYASIHSKILMGFFFLLLILHPSLIRRLLSFFNGTEVEDTVFNWRSAFKFYFQFNGIRIHESLTANPPHPMGFMPMNVFPPWNAVLGFASASLLRTEHPCELSLSTSMSL